MSGFAALKTFEDSLDKAVPVHTPEVGMDFLRKAVNAPSIPEVKKLIQEEIIHWNMLNKIELKTETGVIRELSDQPRHFLSLTSSPP